MTSHSRPRLLHAQAAGDLVAHARVAVLDVVAAGMRAAPELVQLGRQGAGGADDDVVARAGRGIARRIAHRADDFGVVGQLALRRVARQHGDALVPVQRQGLGPRRPRRIGMPAGERRAELLQRAARVGHQRDAAPLAGVERLHVDGQAPGVGGEQRVRAGDEILQPRADGDHDIGFARQRVGRRRAGDADRADVERVVPGQTALAGLGFGHRHAMRAREGGQRGTGLAVEHAAAGDDQRPLGAAQQRGRGFEFARVGAGPANAQHGAVRETSAGNRRPWSARPAAAPGRPGRRLRGRS